MTFFDFLSISVALAMDCFAVAVTMGAAHGMNGEKVNVSVERAKAMRMALLFGLFQAFMPLMSIAVGQVAREWLTSWHGWVALVILAVLGGHMIWEDLMKDAGDEERTMKSVSSASLKVIMLLAVATSIDSLAMGVVLVPLSTFKIAEGLLIIGVGSFAFTLLGHWIGTLVGNVVRQYRPKLIGGVMLIAIGVKIFLT